MAADINWEFRMAKLKFKRRRQYQRDEKPEKIFKEMTENYLDVLREIEMSILLTCKSNDEIDDRVIVSALETAIAGTEAEEQLPALLVNNLTQTRKSKITVGNDIWIKGLKVVLQSVHTHSDIRSGDRDYLTFILNFVV